MTPTKFTKAQRHAIYKKALKTLERDPQNKYGLCKLIGEAGGGVSAWMTTRRKVHLPEFEAQKPFNEHWRRDWWPRTASGRQCRIDAIKRMISLSSPKSKQQ